MQPEILIFSSPISCCRPMSANLRAISCAIGIERATCLILALHRRAPPSFIFAAFGITALGSNAQPTGGTAATQPVAPSMTTAQIDALVQEMAPAVSKFRDQSSPLKVALDGQTLNLGDSKSIRIASVGLGVRIISHHSAVISFINALAGAIVDDL